jgi:hypothetical protein
MKRKKQRDIFDVPLDSEEGQMISAIAQQFAEGIKEMWPDAFEGDSVPEIMLAVKKFWNLGIIEVDYDQEKDGFNICLNPIQALRYMESEMA